MAVSKRWMSYTCCSGVLYLVLPLPAPNWSPWWRPDLILSDCFFNLLSTLTVWWSSIWLEAIHLAPELEIQHSLHSTMISVHGHRCTSSMFRQQILSLVRWRCLFITIVDAMTIRILYSYTEDMEFHQVKKIWSKQVKTRGYPAERPRSRQSMNLTAIPAQLSYWWGLDKRLAVRLLK